MSGPFGSSQWMYASGAFYNGVATQSLRFDDGSSADLTKTFGSGNQKTWTWSCWVKRSALGGSKMLLSNYNSGSDVAWIYFNSSNQFYFQNYEGGNQLELKTNALYRDVSSWYHVVVALDTTQATASNRAKIYINGEQITSFATSTYPSQNADLKINTNSESHKIGSAGSQYYFDGYMAEVNFVDGSALAPTSFGELKSGTWIPKAYTGSYGTNGFRLQFNQTGTGTASSSTIGADTSGNANHFSSSGIVASDCAMPDSPELNFATLNPIVPNDAGNFSEGNLRIGSGSGWDSVASTFSFNSSKYYFEALIDSSLSSSTYSHNLGVTINPNDALFRTTGVFQGQNSDSFGVVVKGSSADYYNNGSVVTTLSGSYAQNDIMQVAIDADNGKCWLGINNSWIGGGNPSTDTTPTFTFTAGNQITPHLGLYASVAQGSNTEFSIINFGQDSTFAGAVSAGGNADANDIGDFKYMPSGYLALCTSNLPEPTISPNETSQADDYFNTVTYTGDGTTDRDITGVGFQPDWVWVKERSSTSDHRLHDNVRGAGKVIRTNSTDAELDRDEIDSFIADGFHISGAIDGIGAVNENTQTYVAWNWKAGGTAVSNTDGSITSSVSANTDAGFSIVSYTGNGTAGATVGHGISKPDVVIVKSRESTSGGLTNWRIFHTSLGATKNLVFATNAALTATNIWNDTPPTASVFSVGNHVSVNDNTKNYIAYCFAEIDGFSKFGTYTGNGSTSGDGTFVYLGFRPAWIMIKRTDSADDWEIQNTKTSPINVSKTYIFANTSDAENTSGAERIDFVSNGFKTRVNASTFNASGGTYIYISFAETPFKYSLGR